MIYIYGTSHVSEESMHIIDEKIEEHDPDLVALELDMPRLQALLSDNETGDMPLFGRLIMMFQKRIGERTGVMPGSEMVHAYIRCAEQDRDIALIDQDIRITLQRLKEVRRKEKVKAVASMIASVILPGTFDFNEIPEDRQIGKMLDEVAKHYPGIYRVLIEERNLYMSEALNHLQNDNPDSDIVAFVGAGHKEELEQMVEGQRKIPDFQIDEL